MSNAGPGFGERMQSAADDSAVQLNGQPIQLSPEVLPDAAALPGAQPVTGEAGELDELGLLEIIEQQLAEIEARDAAQGDTLSVMLQPVSATEVDEMGERAGWPSNPLPPLSGANPATRQTESQEALLDAQWQARAAEAGPVPSANSGELTRAPAHMQYGPVQAQSLGLTPQGPLALDTQASLSAESLLAAVETPEGPLTAAERLQTTQPQALERALKLQAPEARWGEQMLHALRENVGMQLQQKIQSATIRLDPPELGSLEILLSHESGRLNVQLTAVNADVARLLQQTSDRLRQELVSQHFVQVNVQVGADSGGQQGQQRQRAALAAEELPLAARTLEQEQQDSRAAERARDVLITV
ncbi:flagellar hook-length control protein FliK [Pseudomonas saudiphocaensis]|uniref:Flagellar hook-length control protein n=1 Tax=Pseudomonas saudiphocaensis TaxID=1499686 RepID=A0A078LVS1_9PSED|nr:flagellar hook-length control protein FliK [Pseudomonas saudiphocaensis]CDZ95370.1 flagellar hook-length control protein [Pseudomonas saudiphocaensis]